MSKNKCAILLTTFIVLLVSFQACDNSINNSEEVDYSSAEPLNSGIVIGRVQSGTSGYNGELLYLEEANVAMGEDLHTLTNKDGMFTLVNVTPGSKIPLSFAKEDYVSTTAAINVEVGQTTFVNVVLAEAGTVKGLDNSGGVVVDEGASITFENDALLRGEPTFVELTYFNPNVDYYVDEFPGDFSGRSNEGIEKVFESLGLFHVKLKDRYGHLVEIREGKTATLDFPLPEDLPDPPSSLSLWYYDKNEGVWIEEGSATLTSDGYRGNISHVDFWSLGKTFEASYITGRIVNNDGNPVNYSHVQAKGVTYAGSYDIYTGSDGNYSVRVKPNSTVTISASKGCLNAETTTVSLTPSSGAETNINDIVILDPWATATLVWGYLPSDLDCHLNVPASSDDGSSGYHLYYATKGDYTSYPYTKLDFDFQFGFGPENISFMKKLEGKYQFYVYLYGAFGTGTLQSSDAKVALNVNNNLYVFNCPNSGSTQHRYWHVLDMDVDESGSVSLNSVNKIQETAPASSGQLVKEHLPSK